MGLFLANYLPYSSMWSYWGYALLLCTILHAVLSIFLVTLGDGKKKKIGYMKQNAGAYAQRIFGIVMIILIYLHMSAYGYINENGAYILKEPTKLTFIAEVLLVLIAGGHIVLSLPKAAITLGMITQESEYKKYKNLSYMIFFVVAGISLNGLFSYFLG
jgi:succinate dehydrogenase/fumarate reductase cytochrome b subunit